MKTYCNEEIVWSQGSQHCYTPPDYEGEKE